MSGGDEGIGVEESTDFGIVVTGLQIIEPKLCGALVVRENERFSMTYFTHKNLLQLIT